MKRETRVYWKEMDKFGLRPLHGLHTPYTTGFAPQSQELNGSRNLTEKIYLIIVC